MRIKLPRVKNISGNPGSAQVALNAAFAEIQDVLNAAASKTDLIPMEADLDMDGFRVYVGAQAEVEPNGEVFFGPVPTDTIVDLPGATGDFMLMVADTSLNTNVVDLPTNWNLVSVFGPTTRVPDAIGFDYGILAWKFREPGETQFTITAAGTNARISGWVYAFSNVNETIPFANWSRIQHLNAPTTVDKNFVSGPIKVGSPQSIFFHSYATDLTTTPFTEFSGPHDRLDSYGIQNNVGVNTASRLNIYRRGVLDETRNILNSGGITNFFGQLGFIDTGMNWALGNNVVVDFDDSQTVADTGVHESQFTVNLVAGRRYAWRMLLEHQNNLNHNWIYWSIHNGTTESGYEYRTTAPASHGVPLFLSDGLENVQIAQRLGGSFSSPFDVTSFYDCTVTGPHIFRIGTTRGDARSSTTSASDDVWLSAMVLSDSVGNEQGFGSIPEIIFVGNKTAANSTGNMNRYSVPRVGATAEWAWYGIEIRPAIQDVIPPCVFQAHGFPLGPDFGPNTDVTTTTQWMLGAATSGYEMTATHLAFPQSQIPNAPGRYYFEYTVDATAGSMLGFGYAYAIGVSELAQMERQGYPAHASGMIGGGPGYAYESDGTTISFGADEGITSATYTVGDVIGCGLNLIDNQVTFYKNGTLQRTIALNAGNRPFIAQMMTGERNNIGRIEGNFRGPFGGRKPVGFAAWDWQNEVV
jgi:hypothetical protein